ncbi:MAG TPA: diaminopimelate epimerase [Planctomycetota bacterium]|nr:diaminopimelate epimerase [Planctomycetota bacterium]
MKFTKMHGAGNDYVYVDAFREKVADPSALSIALSDRHTGIGSDGLILIAPSKKADFRMIMFNADGSEGSMCGNGIRCIGKYVFDHGLTKKKALTIETRSGTVSLDLHAKGGKVEQVTVDMGPARPVPREFHVRADGVKPLLEETCEGYRGYVASMGNPHFVIPVDSTPTAPVTTKGPLIEKHPDFPSKVNVEFVQILTRAHVRQRTWERGSGETFACGSGACAVGFALSRQGLTDPHVEVDLLGGTLQIEVGIDGRVFMTGPAVEVYSGEFPSAARTTKRGRSR